jgi:tetratricopeptide (TPR) repeat protein/tRNA A-37 threonylcarbamoyl transferase component Bud32
MTPFRPGELERRGRRGYEAAISMGDILPDATSATPRTDVEADWARAGVFSRLFGGPSMAVRVGRFVLLDRIGAGGMGVVYAGYDAELSRKVAIKIVRSGTEVSAQRIVREAKAMARLSHPNVVTVYEAGTVDGEVFFAMEFVDGMDLRKWCDERHRGWREVLRVLIDAGRGLEAAHAADMVHRDFKPQNVLLTKDGVAKVGDFGLARTADSDRGETNDEYEVVEHDTSQLHSLTQTGAVVGTPAYMSKEQFDGRPPSPKGDQFSFCVTAYEVLYGERPFQSSSLVALMEEVSEGRVQPVPAGSSVPRWLRRVLLKGLDPDPDRRHGSMTELLGALEAGLGRRRRHAGAALGAATLLGASLASLGQAASQSPAERCQEGAQQAWADSWNPQSRATVVDAMTTAGATSARVEAVAARLDAYVEQWQLVHRGACEATHVRKEQSERALDLQAACLDTRQHRVEALIEFLHEPTDGMLERVDEVVLHLPAVDDCEDLEALQRQVPPPQDPTIRETVRDLGRVVDEALLLGNLGESERAGETLEGVIEAADATGYHPLSAEARLTELSLQSAVGEAGVQRFREAVWHAEAGGDDDASIRAWQGLGASLVHFGRYDEALAAFEVADALLTKVGDPPAKRAKWHAQLSTLYTDRRNYAEAVENAQRAIDIEEELFGESHALSLYYGNLATAYSLEGDVERASAAYERARLISVRLRGEEHPDTALWIFNLGRMAAKRQEWDVSNAYYERAIEIRRATNGPDDVYAALALNNLGQNYGDMGYPSEAIAKIDEAIAILTRRLGENHRMLLRLHRGLAEVQRDAGHLDQALASARKAHAISLRSQGAEHPETAYSLRRVAEIHLDRDEPAAARPLLEQALTILADTEEEPAELGYTRFFVARAMWANPEEREAALEIARESERLAAEGGTTYARDLEQIRGWLASR